ncbi:hypothetical protein, partial [Azotobacter chroococcum]|uniref:hypothetical protein n=1 Tax=Azotobacter chroococcum TaxID=353 RepID=UPI001A954EE5
NEEVGPGRAAQNPEVAGVGEIVFPPPGLPIYSSMTLLFKRLVIQTFLKKFIACYNKRTKEPICL